MKINASITDFPIFSSLDTFFREFKEAGVDGVEMVLGVKSRFRASAITKLSKKYNLPVASVHQPPWSGIGLYFDEEFFAWAKNMGVDKIVCHPLTFHTFESKAMKKYFEHLARMQGKYDVHIMLENMPNDSAYNKLHQFPGDTIVPHMQRIMEVAEEYGFLLTYDVSHAEFTKPQEQLIIQKMFGQIGNIHLSSFAANHRHHLPLTMGRLDNKGFLTYLSEKKYNGLITLEVYYPQVKLLFNTYEFGAIADSVNVFRTITDTLSR